MSKRATLLGIIVIDLRSPISSYSSAAPPFKLPPARTTRIDSESPSVHLRRRWAVGRGRVVAVVVVVAVVAVVTVVTVAR